MLHLCPVAAGAPTAVGSALVEAPAYTHHWDINVLYGPHGAPDFFTPDDVATFFATDWEVHYNSSRTGVRLIGPKPQWARSDGGEAGLHPSNIHDNAYAIGAIDFTGDMPVILGPDGPSLGGFVCPAVVVNAELWKLGQLRPGDTVRFHRLSLAQAGEREAAVEAALSSLAGALPATPSDDAEAHTTPLAVPGRNPSNFDSLVCNHGSKSAKAVGGACLAVGVSGPNSLTGPKKNKATNTATTAANVFKTQWLFFGAVG